MKVDLLKPGVADGWRASHPNEFDDVIEAEGKGRTESGAELEMAMWYGFDLACKSVMIDLWCERAVPRPAAPPAFEVAVEALGIKHEDAVTIGWLKISAGPPGVAGDNDRKIYTAVSAYVGLAGDGTPVGQVAAALFLLPEEVAHVAAGPYLFLGDDDGTPLRDRPVYLDGE
jgi:hypothetical protein